MIKNNEIDLALLKRLSEADGIPGREREVSRIIAEYGQTLALESQYDNLGSIILKAAGCGQGPKVMLASHLDEVGFMVRSITEEGYLNLLPVGGWWGHVMPAQEMTVTTETGQKYRGIVGARPPHGLSKTEKAQVMSPIDLYLDLGVSSKAFVEEMGIQIGDMITPFVTFQTMNDPNYFAGKAFDDRCCVAVGLEVLRQIKEMDHQATVYFAGTVQEEVGIRGARTAVHAIQPDIAIALDVTASTDTPLEQGTMRLGQGVTLAVLDGLTIGNKGLVALMETIVADLQLDVAYDFMTIGGTDACNIHKMLDGVVTMAISIPTRYMHSPRLLIHRKDYVQTIQLITEFCRRVDWEDLQKMRASVGVEKHPPGEPTIGLQNGKH
jgi:putative aminopeptidase FrvX